MTSSGRTGRVKDVRIAELKARLSQYLRVVRGGETISVLDRETPVAQIVPVREGVVLRIRKPVPGSPPPNRVSLPKPLTLNLDIVDLLLEERQGHRRSRTSMRRCCCAWPSVCPIPWRSGRRLSAACRVRSVTESLRTLDRLRLRARLPDAEVATRRNAILSLIESLAVELDGTVLDRAGQPMPRELGTLDPIHLATALLWKAMTGERLSMATHDEALGTAAKAHGLPVIGAPE